MASVVGEEVTGEAPHPDLKLSYASVLKDPTFLARQRQGSGRSRRPRIGEEECQEGGGEAGEDQERDGGRGP